MRRGPTCENLQFRQMMDYGGAVQNPNAKEEIPLCKWEQMCYNDLVHRIRGRTTWKTGSSCGARGNTI